MADVGAAAGVSDRTVSNVLSGKVFVSPETRAAVLEAVQTLGYRMNATARSLRTGRTGTITLAIPDLSIDYFSELTQAVMREAEAHGWAVTLQQTDSSRARELAIVSGADRDLGDGLLFQPHALGQEDLAALTTTQPMVLLGDRISGGRFPLITMANVAGARLATEHLLGRGRRRIAAIGVNPSDTTETAATLRLAGYGRALQNHGVPMRAELLGPAVHWRRQDGAAAVEELLARGVPFDAIFCFNDTLAFGALHALQAHRLRVPEDVAVVGFDNVHAAAYCSPPLTTIDAGSEQIARQAVSLLAELLGQARPAQPQTVVAQHRLVLRASA